SRRIRLHSAMEALLENLIWTRVVWDVQMTKSSDYVGWMFHTRRHLFDELDWIHPRYQRATGGLISSHVFLNPPARKEIIQTIRNFHDRYFDEKGIPHDWDKG